MLTFPFDRKRKITHRLLVWQSCLFMFLLPIWKIRITRNKKVNRKGTYVMISNHQSILDILLINCLGYSFKWVSKIENTKVPFLGWYLSMADYITVDRQNDESKAMMLARSYNCLKKDTSLMIFPEGTRYNDNETGPFKRGAFQLAIEAGVPILPVVVDGTGGVLPKKGFILNDVARLQMKVLDPVYPSSFGTNNPEELAEFFRKIINTELVALRNKQV